jgi:hypothetical protein
MRHAQGELEQLDKGLQGAKPLDDLIGKLAEENDAKGLYAKGVYYVKWTGYTMAVAGIYFLALKEKVHHGPFKKMFLGKDKPVNYMHAWQCMKAAHVVAEHPVFGRLRSSRAFRALLYLPEPEQKALADEMRDIPEEEIDELLPGKIQKRYDEIRADEKKRRPPRKKKLSDEEAQRILALEKAARADKPWTEIKEFWHEAIGALSRLAKAAKALEMKPEHFDEIFEREMLDPLTNPLGELTRKWHPIEEIQKREKIVEARGARHS